MRGAHFGRGRSRPASGGSSLPARSCATACATARATLRTSSCTACVAVERVVAGRVGLVVADVAVEPRLRAGVDQAHPVEPVAEAAAQALRCRRRRRAPPRRRRGPPGASDSPSPSSSSAFASSAFLPWVEVGSGLPPSAQTRRSIISLSGLGGLVPVRRRDDDHAVRRDPALVDLVHPVVGLAQRMVRVAAAGPVAQRHGGRDAALARMDVPAVVGGEQAQVEQVDLDAAAARAPRAPAARAGSVFEISPGQVPSLRGEPLMSEHARRRLRLGPRGLRARRCGPWPRASRPRGRSPGRRSRAGLARDRRLAAFLVGLPGDHLDPRERGRRLWKAGSRYESMKRSWNSARSSLAGAWPLRTSVMRRNLRSARPSCDRRRPTLP